MMFKDLQKLIQSRSDSAQVEILQRLKNKEFWIWNSVDEHRKTYFQTNCACCFNHIIGLPQKDGIDKPLFDYERIIFDSLIKVNVNVGVAKKW